MHSFFRLRFLRDLSFSPLPLPLLNSRVPKGPYGRVPKGPMVEHLSLLVERAYAP
jgi:hypothetical protein